MPPTITFEELYALPPQGLGHESTLQALGFEEPNPAGFDADFRENWDLWYTVREFVQNALDATGTVNMETQWDARGRYMGLIQDEGSGVGLRSILLGQRKAKQPGNERANALESFLLRGRYGEGMKYAMLPVIRTGRRILVRTVGFDLTTYVGERRLISTQRESIPGVMYYLRPNTITQGTTVAITDLDIGAVPVAHGGTVDARLRFASGHRPSLLVPASVPHAVSGALAEAGLKVPNRAVYYDMPGTLFVRDIFVEGGKPDMLFGYNLWFEDAVTALDPNRDHVKNDWLRQEIRDLFANDYTGKLVRTLLERLAEVHARSPQEAEALIESQALRVDWAGLPAKAAEAAHEYLTAQHGTYAYAATNEDARAIEHMNVAPLPSTILPTFIAEGLARYGFVKPAAYYRNIVKNQSPYVLVRPRSQMLAALDTYGVKLAYEDKWYAKEIYDSNPTLAKLLGARTLPAAERDGYEFAARWASTEANAQSTRTPFPYELRREFVCDVIEAQRKAAQELVAYFDVMVGNVDYNAKRYRGRRKTLTNFVWMAGRDASNSVLGYYSQDGHELAIELGRVGRLHPVEGGLLDVLLHELSHLYGGGAPDISEKMQNALSVVGVHLTQLMSQPVKDLTKEARAARRAWQFLSASNLALGLLRVEEITHPKVTLKDARNMTLGKLIARLVLDYNRIDHTQAS